MEVDEIDTKLVKILSTEISRDGGASLVRDLKDYTSINSLLKRCSKPKLLAFLECFPDTFRVNRAHLPHVVYLLKDVRVSSDDAPTLKQLEDAKATLLDRVICILKKEKSKDARRERALKISGVKTVWLLKQCKHQLHRFLRLSGTYQIMYSGSRHDVELVGSDGWNRLVLQQFLSIAEGCGECGSKDGRIFLKEEEMQCINVPYLASVLTEKVDEDGGTHISLGLLLHRYAELRKLLGGHDLMSLKEEHGECFNQLDIFKRDNQIYFQSKASKEGRGRMEVDETGLFSVTSAKWGTAFASMMANQCRSMLLKEPEHTIAIDLTASVGGMTLPLAKVFQSVIATEIDGHRAELCRRNMEKYGVLQRVDIRNEDSVHVIPGLAEEIHSCPRIIVIDPRKL